MGKISDPDLQHCLLSRGKNYEQIITWRHQWSRWPVRRWRGWRPDRPEHQSSLHGYRASFLRRDSVTRFFSPPPHIYKKYSNMALNLRKYWIENLNCDSCCNVLDTAKSSYTVSAESRIPQIMLKKLCYLPLPFLSLPASWLSLSATYQYPACPCHLPTSIWPIAASYLTVSGRSLPATY